jgi:prophage regulatory protein
MNSSAIVPSVPGIRMLRLPEVCRITGLGRAMIYRLQAGNRFPRSVKITDFAVGWVDAEVQVWLSKRLASRRGELSEEKAKHPGRSAAPSNCGA